MQHPSRDTGRSRRRRLAAQGSVLTAAALIAGVISPYAMAAPPSGGALVTGAPAGKPGADTTPITLITGDTVTVSRQPDGSQAVDVTAKAGNDKTFLTHTDADGDLYVIPSDAESAVTAGVLDQRLFNVTQLIRDGVADRKTNGKGAQAADIPLIVGYDDEPTRTEIASRTAELPAADIGPVLDRLDMAGVHVEKKKAADFWHAIAFKQGKPTKQGRATATPGASKIAKVWYDGKAKATLDTSVPQIGAPTAWAAGYDGKGVKVAVLDTGADLNNADIASKVVATKSFVAGQEVQDGHGHGTHVASTVAGLGTNSDGKYKGVAPGAELVVGKVLNNSGSGNDSGIIAGMEWAVTQGVKVVSMSLGGPASGSGDAMTEAVDRLSASTGTLFTIAAGNAGPGASTLGSPGIADSALTVGAVDRDDALANFSSRGPRLGDSALKPEVTAPGVGIVAARAAGTTMGTPTNAYYTAANGTSMATPHVAGAAAILAQRHPDWSGARIKADLMATAKLNAANTVYEQGSGRIDVAAALAPKLEIGGAADFGLVEWQSGAYPAEARELTLTNTTGAPLTVALGVSAKGAKGEEVPADALTTDAPTVTVPANGTAKAQVKLAPDALTTGLYSGTVTASVDGAVIAHAPVGFHKEAEKHALTLNFTGRGGQPVGTTRFTIQNLAGTYFQTYNVSGGTNTLRLPADTYTITGNFETRGGANASTAYATDFFSLPHIDLGTKDETLTVDGRKATDLDLRLPDEKRPLEMSTYSMQSNRFVNDGKSRATQGIAGLANFDDERMGAVPSAAPGAGDGEFKMSSFLTEREPVVRASVSGRDGFGIAAKTSSYLQRWSGKREFEVVDVGTGTAAEIAAAGVKGKAALLHADKVSKVSVLKALEEAGAGAAIVVPTDDSPQTYVTYGVTLANIATSYADGTKLADRVKAGRTTVVLDGRKESGYTYSGHYVDTGALPANMTRTQRRDDFVKVQNSFHSDKEQRVGWESLHAWGDFPMTSVRSSQWLYQGLDRDDYVLVGKDLSYQEQVVDIQTHVGRIVEPIWKAPAKGGSTRHKTWYAPVPHLSNYTELPCNYCRTDKGMVLSPGLGGDSDPTHAVLGGVARTWTYYRDGRQITDPTQLLVPGRAQYRLVSNTTRANDYPGVTLGKNIRTELTVTSATPETNSVDACATVQAGATRCEALPVILLDYGMKADLLNRARAGAPFTVSLDASRGKGFTGTSAMAGAKVSVSYDGGATFKSVPVLRTGKDSFRAAYLHPRLSATDGYVTLRTEVWDSAGNRTVQTIDRAYALK